jgi:hypothetical protein
MSDCEARGETWELARRCCRWQLGLLRIVTINIGAGRLLVQSILPTRFCRKGTNAVL